MQGISARNSSFVHMVKEAVISSYSWTDDLRLQLQVLERGNLTGLLSLWLSSFPQGRALLAGPQLMTISRHKAAPQSVSSAALATIFAQLAPRGGA